MFPESQRKIFKYRDGRGGEVFGDPLAIRRRMVKALPGEDIDSLHREAAQPLAFANPAIDKLLDMVRAAFGVAPLDPATGDGLTEGELWDLLRSFYDWEEALGEATGGTPSTSPSTDIPPASP